MDPIRYELEARPGDGETQALMEGITWLRMPLPFQLNHINLWLLRDSGGWVIVDTGLGTGTTRDTWRKVFSDGMRNDPATHVVVTHLHPDHAGCASWLVSEFGVDLWMTREEYLLCRALIADTGKDAPADGMRFYRAAGFDDEQLARYRENFGMFGKVVPDMPQSFRRICDGDTLEFAGHEWEVIVGRGHSPEHACLYDRSRNIVIAGDQILPTISPNVSVLSSIQPQSPPKSAVLSSEYICAMPAKSAPSASLRRISLATSRAAATGSSLSAASGRRTIMPSSRISATRMRGLSEANGS